jgi:hypothetical protein
MSCRGICIHHEAVKGVRGYRYAEGQKRCQVCCVFLIWEGAFCPCCGMRLRARPRSSKGKAMWQEMTIATAI